MQGKWGLRAVALLAVGALSLHELSYWLIDSASGVGGHTHSYIPLAAGLVTVLLLLACGSFARTLLCAMRGIEEEEHPPSFRVLWPVLSAALIAVFSLQEWVESWVSPGHPSGVAHLANHVGPGGLVIATVIAAVIALLLRGARSAVAALARRHLAHRPRHAPVRTASAQQPFFVSRLNVLAGKLAGRAPPLTS